MGFVEDMFEPKDTELYVRLQEWFGPAVSVGGTLHPFFVLMLQ